MIDSTIENGLVIFISYLLFVFIKFILVVGFSIYHNHGLIKIRKARFFYDSIGYQFIGIAVVFIPTLVFLFSFLYNIVIIEETLVWIFAYPLKHSLFMHLVLLIVAYFVLAYGFYKIISKIQQKAQSILFIKYDKIRHYYQTIEGKNTLRSLAYMTYIISIIVMITLMLLIVNMYLIIVL